jgi:hypothetical protein
MLEACFNYLDLTPQEKICNLSMRMYYYKEKKPRPFQKARTRPTILTAMNVVQSIEKINKDLLHI